jgi:hypothetical protein
MPAQYRIGLCVLFILFLQISFSLAGEVYRWTDEKGTVHFTDDPSQVPQSSIDRVEKKKMPGEFQKDEGKTVNPEKEDKMANPERRESPARVQGYQEEIEKKIEMKRSLEKRASELEEELKVCELRLNKIEEEAREHPLPMRHFFSETRHRWMMISPYHEERIEIREKMNLIKKEITTIQDRLSRINQSL